jgi:hypothetical protein
MDCTFLCCPEGGLACLEVFLTVLHADRNYLIRSWLRPVSGGLDYLDLIDLEFYDFQDGVRGQRLSICCQMPGRKRHLVMNGIKRGKMLILMIIIHTVDKIPLCIFQRCMIINAAAY